MATQSIRQGIKTKDKRVNQDDASILSLVPNKKTRASPTALTTTTPTTTTTYTNTVITPETHPSLFYPNLTDDCNYDDDMDWLPASEDDETEMKVQTTKFDMGNKEFPDYYQEDFLHMRDDRQSFESSDAAYANRLYELACATRDQRPKRAFRLLHTAARLGHVEAVYELGMAYCEGCTYLGSAFRDRLLNTTDPRRRGLRLLKIAANGHSWDAARELEQIYHTGRYGVQPDDDQVLAFFRKKIEAAMSILTEIPWEEALQEWRERMGQSSSKLEQALRSGAIALMNHGWLVQHAMMASPGSSSRANKQRIVRRRQDLPPEAFLTFEQTVRATAFKAFATKGQPSLPIIALSYMWLEEYHPDPQGDTLRAVSKKLMAIDYPVGLFWDLCSLHQHGENNQKRSLTEEGLFQQGLAALPELYSHQLIQVFRIREFPPTIATNDKSQASSPRKGYDDRGWPFAESCWAGLHSRITHSEEKIIDLHYGQGHDGECHENPNYDEEEGEEEEQEGGRAWTGQIGGVLSPALFEERLKLRQFTNKKDGGIVVEIYTKHFRELFESKTSWEVGQFDEATAVADIIRRGLVPNLQQFRIYLDGLTCHAFDWKDLVNTLDCCPNLRELYIEGCRIGLDGSQLIADVLSHRDGGPNLKELGLNDDPTVTDEAVTVLAPLFPSLVCLNLSFCNIGDEGCHALADILIEAKYPPIAQVVFLGNSLISDKGYHSLARLVHHIAEKWPAIEGGIDISGAGLSSKARKQAQATGHLKYNVNLIL